MANEFIIRNGFQSRGNGQITGSLSVTGGITGSSTGSFTGDGSGLTGLVSSSYAVTSSYALTAEAGGGTGAAVAFPWKFKEPTGSADPGSGQFRLNSTSSSAITEIYVNDFTSNGIDASNLLDIIDTSTRIYLQQNDDASRALLFSVSSAPTDNTGWFTIPVTYLQGSQIPKKDKICGWILARSGSGGGGGTDTNFANTDLTFTADRNHDTAGNSFSITADAGAFNSAQLGFTLDPGLGMGAPATTSSYIGVGDNYMTILRSSAGAGSINMYVANTSSISATANSLNINSSNKDHDVVIEGVTDTTLFVTDAATDRVGIGKSAPNAKLDVNGDTIITGSLQVFTVPGTEGFEGSAYLQLLSQSAWIGHGDGGGIWFTSEGERQTNIYGGTVTFEDYQTGDVNIYLTSSYFLVNNDQLDLDFIAASENNANMLTVDAATDRVGIGKSAPNSVLDVNGDTIITGSLTVTGTASYLKSVVSASNSGGAVTVAMTEATYPSGQVVKLNCKQGTDTIQYTLPAVTEGLHYTFTGQGNLGSSGLVRFVGPAEDTITGMVACSDGNDIIHTAAARVAITTMSFAAGEFKNGSKVDFVCDGTNWVVTGVHGGSTGSITLS